MKKAGLFAVIVLMAVSGPTATALQTEEVLDVVAMPLAIAAVSEVTGVPMDSLVDLAVAMNAVDVPPGEFVEVIRYSPVLLADPVREAEIVTFVTNEVDRGITNEDLVLALQNRIRDAGIHEFRVDTEQRVMLDRSRMVPDTVVRRVDEVRSHPHGGPPGQIKKELGVQTGAEVVHGTHPGKDRPDRAERPGRGKPDVKPDGDRGGPPPHANKGRGKPKDDDHPGKGKGKNRGDR